MTWDERGREFEYVMPRAPRWKRLPIIRHIRAIWIGIQVELHYARWAGIGIRTGSDDWVVEGIWRGKERNPAVTSQNDTGVERR